MKVAIEGCAHGELEKIYDSLMLLQERENIKIDLLICCGDFQATRNTADLRAMAVPAKYQSMCSFYKYYSGEKVAPILTIFIGGNHEASNHLQELPYGGWAAPNIYYMGYASILNIAGVRVAGLSGIYKGHDFMKGRFEKPPYSEDSKRSVYHIRNLDVFRFKQVKGPIDVFLSHDWPRGVHRYGNEEGLLKQKPFFRDDILSNSLGSKPCEELLHLLKPAFWFSAHLHVKFAALVPHESDGAHETRKTTKFLALDKCLPKRKFLQVIDIPHDPNKPIELEYDLEWLTILHLTNHLVSVEKSYNYMPGPGNVGRWVFTPAPEELDLIKDKFGNNFKVPKSFIQTAEAFSGCASDKSNLQAPAQVNPQTKAFCSQLGIDDPMELLLKRCNENSSFNSSNISFSTLPGDLTPERSGDMTHASFSFNESSDTVGDGGEFSLVQCSPDTNGKTSTPVAQKRIGLVLPMPLNHCDDLNDPDDEDKASSSKLGDISASLDFGANIVDNEETSGPNMLELSPIAKTETDSTKEKEEKSQPRVKKFRRRNESLYTSVDEDG